MDTTIAAPWGKIIADIQRQLGPTRYDLWFKSTAPIECDEDTLKIGTPSSFLAEWLETHYLEMLTKAARRHIGRPLSVKFVVDPALFWEIRRQETEAKQELLEEVSAPANSRMEPERYSLSNFVVGACNSIAYAAALKVVESPGSVYNPLFLHGGVGLGKTHILVAIANALRSKMRAGEVEYVSGEGFTNRFLFALGNRALDAFRAKFRKLKLLVIDDVHFIANKRATEDEFLNTFNTLSLGGCQIVVASDSHPKLIGKLKESLVNRFVSGMVARLDKPDYETRVKIILRKASDRDLKLGADVVEFVARHMKGSVRDIEGAVNTLAAHGLLSRGSLGMTEAAAALSGLLESGSRPVSLPDIEAAVTSHAGLSEGDLRSRRRTHQVSRARHIAMYLARKLGGFSYSEIGAYFGRRNHSSAVSAVKKILREAAGDEELTRTLAALEAQFGA